MRMGQNIFRRLADESELAQMSLPGMPIVEVAGDRRVLVENHHGVCAYSTERILIKVAYGCVCIQGCALELLRMSADQLIIRGKIESIVLQRKGLNESFTL